MIQNSVPHYMGNLAASLPKIECVKGFIKAIWNENNHTEISNFLHDDFTDHSLPFTSLQGKAGLLIYLKELAKKVYHNTEILELSTLDELVICKIRIVTKLLGDKGNESIRPEIIDGYRDFRMSDGKIIGHWENDLRGGY
ncbi:nuclear transport factor 2 family protein [Dyadobacter sp. NIV53]|uniref:nuclear transport factor 2 family protein n=1 Tax=Dyadobacter sp. NIV53 TaxID=2861765 RepID=UPI001C86F06B|nr:nuclear transport factor 2 family protein [Dyadobacter sp. NIV53]